MEFKIDPKQHEKVEAWQKEQIQKSIEKQKGTPAERITKLTGMPNCGAIGGLFTYSFTPTSIGIITKIECGITKEELDITLYEDF